MVRKKPLLVVLLLILLGGTTVGALNYTAGNEDSVTRVLGYDVYKIEGSGNYIIYYPLPNGSVKVLKKGKAGGFFPTFVKVPRHEWIKELSTAEKALYAPPTPLILYITEDGKLGVKSITSSRIKLESEKTLNLKGDYQVQAKDSCPQGWIDFGGRYCIDPQWSLHFDSRAKSKTFDEWVSVMGLKIENRVAKEVEHHWLIQLSRSTYSYWTFGIDVGPFTALSVSKGHRFEGWKLDISFESVMSIPIETDHWERYLNIRVEYIVANAKVPAYDRFTRSYTEIDIVMVYPIKIHSTGRYTIKESASRGIYFTESNGINPPRITTTPNIWRIPENAKWNKTWIPYSRGEESAIYLRQSQSERFKSSSSLSIPIGQAAGKYLTRISPKLGKFASTISITFGFHKKEKTTSLVEYSVDIKPRKSCYAMYSVLGVNVGTSETKTKVKVPLVFGVITDGKVPSPSCNPRTGVCVDSTNPWGREGD
ncbi:hypothetical protein APY94_06100 [Thermococcus celericrescens]|uniref:Uncharacterized protein n=1 Tax=Thermococcus celericrescens TaxID=227598 RepID=A0A117ITM5_9EURY|nr:hypothetical protein [Thermococcus celericrescens]KUH33393.1 hypothetical protein APY94_06100 [Thermococcus celericrescens]